MKHIFERIREIVSGTQSCAAHSMDYMLRAAALPRDAARTRADFFRGFMRRFDREIHGLL